MTFTPSRSILPLFASLAAFETLLVSLLWNSAYLQAALSATVIGALAFYVTYKLIPGFAQLLLENDICGADLNKQPQDIVSKMRSGDKCLRAETAAKLPKIPESLGVVPAFAYIIGAVLAYAGLSKFPHIALHYASGLITVVTMNFLGFVDDVLDLRWRYKLILPSLASLPIMMIYEGDTTVIIPSILRKIWPLSYLRAFGRVASTGGHLILDLNVFYKIYMSMITTFTSNSINIYAGLNGLEVGQSIIMAAAVLIHNAMEMTRIKHHVLQLESNPATLNSNHHCLSFILTIIFLNVSVALFYFNRYPAKVFVGDTYTTFAGVHFGVVCVMGHFSKMWLLIFIPQIINFILSIPQLLQIVHCPKHRVPNFDEKTGLMSSSPNYTLINLALRILGPTSEESLVNKLLTFQFLCCALGMLFRYSSLFETLFY